LNVDEVEYEAIDETQAIEFDQEYQAGNDSLEVDAESGQIIEDAAISAESEVEPTELEFADEPAIDDFNIETVDGSWAEPAIEESPVPEQSEVDDVESQLLGEPEVFDIDSEYESGAEDFEVEEVVDAEPDFAEQAIPVPSAETLEIDPDSSQHDSSDNEFDEEILEIFLEEANDNLEDIDEAVHKWGENRSNFQYVDDLQRILHTLKGGARMAGVTVLGNLSHNFETYLMGAEGKEIDDDFFSRVLEFQDSLVTELDSIKMGKRSNEAVTEDSQEEVEAEDLEENEEQFIDASSENIIPVDVPGKTQHQVSTSSFKPPVRSINDDDAPMLLDMSAKKGPQEVIKVSASLLEDLVNLAGETSISRGRAEEQISELVFSLDDMQITVDRLQEQVRRLDMETEQQILYRQEQVESEGLEGFDPLEMDRYSQLQQLSRSLLESSSDLIDIKSTLAEKSLDMETLLIQQSRIN